MTSIKKKIREREERKMEQLNDKAHTMTFNQYVEFIKKQKEYYTEKYEKALESENASDSTLTYYAGLKMAFETAYEQAMKVRR